MTMYACMYVRMSMYVYDWDRDCNGDDGDCDDEEDGDGDPPISLPQTKRRAYEKKALCDHDHQPSSFPEEEEIL